MGYTHYWDRQEVIVPWIMSAIVRDFNEVLPAIRATDVDGYGVVLCGGDGTGEPEITAELVCFNGTEQGDLSHETFDFPRVMDRKGSGAEVDKEKGLLFNFCKTAQKPYDIAVTAFLVIAKHHLGDYITVHSDGNIEDWDAAIDICKDVLGYGADFSLPVED